MRNGLRTLVAIGVALVPLVVPPTPASAAVTATAAFTVMVQTPPWGYPVISPPQSGAFSIPWTIACSAVVSENRTVAGPCAFSGAGYAVGNCGLANGTLWGWLEWRELNTGVGSSVWFHVNFQITGTTLIATGTAGNDSHTGPMTVELDFTPVFNPGGPSCLNGTLTDFVATGNATLAVP